jgi:hypothetical protein
MLPIIVFLFACKEDDDLIACTMEFRTIGINVNGGELEDYFTIREINDDTIRFDQFNPFQSNYYTVLDDNFTFQLSNKPPENFTFIGIIDNAVVVEESFVIISDECHIELISGNTSIDL